MTMTEAELKGKTVAQLRALLTEAGLPTTGLKGELIERLVSNGSSDDPSLAAPEASAPTAAPAATAGAASSTAPATTSTGTAAATTEASTTDATPGPSADVTAAEELKKRQDRAKRFGTTVAEDETKKTERAQRFGEVNSDAKMLKGLQKLDQPLKAGSTPKPPKPEAAEKATPKSTNGTSPKKSAPASTSPKKPVDPVVQAADEEAKRKRAERFGVVEAPSAKKTKT